MRIFLLRAVGLPVALAIILLLFALGATFTLAARSVERTGPLHRHLSVMSALQEATIQLENPDVVVSAQEIAIPLERLAGSGLTSEKTRSALRQAIDTLTRHPTSPDARREARRSVHEASLTETRVHNDMLNQLRAQAQAEMEITAIAAVGVPALLLLGFFMLRSRLLTPLEDLGGLMDRIASADRAPRFSRAPVDPALDSLFTSYNQMVHRLSELEASHTSRQADLEAAVRTATRSLVETSQQLARAERLAAMGEVTASLAHELRNPLAGVYMALVNLRRDLPSGDVTERMDQIIAELRRASGLLNAALDNLRQRPEAQQRVHLVETVGQLCALLRYQIPPQVELLTDIPDEITCYVPEGRLRQALLNILLNSAQALGDGPGRIRLSARQNDGALILTVEDTGGGFDQEWLDQPIQPFKTNRPGGTGLGLAMVRRFTTDLGGHLELANRPEGGARVRMILPCVENRHE